MEIASPAREKKLPPTPWGHLPAQMRVLLIAGPLRRGGWLADALAADSATDVRLEVASGLEAGLLRLREVLFDVVLVSHEPGQLDAWEALDAIRAGVGEDQALVVLGECNDAESTVYCLESGGDAYLCTRTATTRSLLWMVARAIERRVLIAEHRRLQQERQQRLRREQTEARQQWEQQRAMIVGRRAAHGGSSAADAECGLRRFLAADASTHLPQSLLQHYRELLRTYVIMGSGHLADELENLAALLAGAHISPREVLQLHLQAVAEMLADIGSRSARHVMNRADMLSLEVLLNLAEQYRAQAMPPIGSPQSSPCLGRAA